MYVGLAMRKHVPTITSETLLTKADQMMEENKLWILLVVEDGILKGSVSKEDVRSALPSGATTFSRHELSYLLSKMTVKDLIRRDIPTVTPEKAPSRATSAAESCFPFWWKDWGSI